MAQTLKMFGSKILVQKNLISTEMEPEIKLPTSVGS